MCFVKFWIFIIYRKRGKRERIFKFFSYSNNIYIIVVMFFLWVGLDEWYVLVIAVIYILFFLRIICLVYISCY